MKFLERVFLQLQRASSGARSRLAGGASLWSGGLGVATERIWVPMRFRK